MAVHTCVSVIAFLPSVVWSFFYFCDGSATSHATQKLLRTLFYRVVKYLKHVVKMCGVCREKNYLTVVKKMCCIPSTLAYFVVTLQRH